MVLYERPPPCDSYGDVNDDGKVDYQEGDYNTDVLIVANYVYFGWDSINDRTPLAEAEFISRADVDNDGVVSMTDAMLIADYATGTIDTFPVCKPVGDITKVELDGKQLPEGGTLDWLLNDDAAIKVYFKNIGDAAITFDIKVTDEDGATLCSKTTGEIAADGAENYIDCGTFTPGAVETKTLTAHIDP